jgi:hypothetical protein
MQRVILRPSHPIRIRQFSPALRSYASAPAPKPTPGPTKPYQHEKAPSPEQSWLTRKLKQSPTAMRAFLKIFGALGYGSSRQVAARRALALYQQLCAGRAEEDREFWANGAPASPPSVPLLNDAFDNSALFFSLWDERMSSPSDVSVLVHSDEPPCVDAHNTSTCAPRAAWTSTHPRAHRPLLPRRRGSHPAGSPTAVPASVPVPAQAPAAGTSRSRHCAFATRVLLHHSQPSKKDATERFGRRIYQEAQRCPTVACNETDEDIP